ncbi:hypothetical protein VD0004_g1895 [Verticillium dahliae]|nr:hypothetical protein VD0004_g1895 [Verticillium dahliae]PNH75597.1 hypothetical protein VD0001_g1987 [Verticillium dahliae]
MKYFATILSSAALAAAHGFVDTAVIGGKDVEFYQPYTDPYTSPVPERISRVIAGNGPVLDVTSPDMQCGGSGSGSKPAALHAPAAAGSTVSLSWTLWPDSHVGPVITYMARCPDAGCDAYEPGTDALWFKIQEAGRKGTTNEWAASALMKAGATADYTIPECLAPGFYLVRHEIIALHQGAEFYPGCHQLEVSGSGSTTPSSGLVAFPGAYSASDAGIDYSPYQTTEEYTIPGPKLFTCSGASQPDASAPAPAPVATDAPVSSAAPVATAPATTTAPTTPTEPATPVEEEPEEPVEDDECPAEDEEEEELPVEDDECPAEDEEEGLDPVAVDDDEYDDENTDEDCPAEPIEEDTEEPVEEDEEPIEDDECPADEEEEPVEEDDEPVEDDECPADDGEEVEEPVAEEDDDEYEDIEECEPVVPTKRQSLHERRSVY